MNDTHITVVGNVVDTPRRNRLSTGSVTNFRLASTARRFDGEAKDFVDGATLWIDVACWGELGGNVAHSVSKGDPVIVQGTIATDSWETDAGRRSAAKIKATSVGLNLARGWAEFHRPSRNTSPAELVPPEVGEPGDPGESPLGDLANRSTDYQDDSATLHGESADDLAAAQALEPAR
ncbi:single-strand DNA-binding protein [Modestobacter sp. DSM 44400]|uniref:single-stranded DNA-binding protein n=1 Tax=Modestobacter sp. DSM 44400 TaxID=1550230 RepID=UPI00089B4DA3|nr:single-stranded DNA-binding protein [Modestobacter sp. DSM 44400]SDY05421.1 single-strand DNA-binding protein [Modestobacter sp. DSM 44400]